jgi:hypothetical protein
MNSPVLIIGFNRPDHLARIIETVRKQAPERLYIAIDGPRHDLDIAAVRSCQELAEEIVWTETHTRFRTRNLGCQRGVIDAVSWMFEHETEGIILEDDSVPTSSFFPFCDELLARYRTEQKVLAISGENRVPSEFITGDGSYRFTYMGAAGSWATWQDRWASFDESRIDQDIVATFRGLARSQQNTVLQRCHWSALMLANRTRAMDSWAYPFMINGLATRRLTATPNCNLVEDHGVGGDARHMQSADPLRQSANEISFPLIHPQTTAINVSAENWSEQYEVSVSPTSLISKTLKFCWRLARR